MRNAALPAALSSSIALLLLGSGLLYFLVISQSVPLQRHLGIMHAPQRPAIHSNPFEQKIVHFDLKGAAPKLNYFMEIFPMLSLLNVTSVLIEYEDMFPYSGQIAILKRTVAYSEDEIAAILEIAKKNKLEVIPLVQTFGHLEFALKYDRFSHLREDPERMDTLCPSENESWTLITEMLTQVRSLHPDAKRIHIGADEAWQIAKDERCLKRLRTELGFSTDRLKLAHIGRTARFARQELQFEEVLAWNDMFGAISDKLMMKYELGTLITPVVWGYAVDVTQPGYFPDGMFERYSKVFDKMMFASAFKGANGIAEIFANISRYFANQQSYVNLYKMHKIHLEGRVKGIVLTGWQRYYHTAPLCELLPVSVPSLITDLIYLENTSLSFAQVMYLSQKFLGCRSMEIQSTPIMLRNETYYPSAETAYMNCTFPGHEIYDLIENMRFFVWRIHRFAYLNSVREVIREQLTDLEQKIRNALSAYFYEEAVDEFISANIAPLKVLL